MAAEVVDSKKPAEQRLFQAIVLQAFEDAMTTQGSKQESYLKKDAHDWFIDKNKSFEEVCWFAGVYPDIIHEKYKQAGGRCICVNGFRWMHRFNKPDKATFPNNLEDRFRNYIIGRIELNQKYDDVIYAFSDQLHAFTMHKIIPEVKTCIA